LQLPTALIDSIQRAPGFNLEAFVEAHSSGKQITSIRINPNKTASNKIFPSFGLNELPKVPWSKYGYYLPERPSFTLDPFFHAGAYYVQEASSMFLEQIFNQELDTIQPIRVLDLCAAPGGKSTHIQSLINSDSLLVSNEVIKGRVHVLTENLTKWGAENVIVTNNDARDFQRLPGFFDVIVMDAPCSGSGLFRKDPSAIEEWSTANVELCSMRQQRIIEDVLPALKENGLLIFSTCSYSIAENENICDWLTEQHPLESIQINLKSDWNIIESISEKNAAAGYRFYPNLLDGEGFFIAAFRNKRNNTGKGNTKIKLDNISANQQQILAPFIGEKKSMNFIKQKEDILAFPSSLAADLAMIQSTLYIKKAGVCIGQIIRNDFIPHHELAVSNLLSNNIETLEVEKETALQFLRKQVFEIPNSKIGWTLMTYNNCGLGWIKIMSNRINNYYPKEWRILNK
jgi:16S rRNA C967 or C1407 C5-methylase (RsmB/RsmF family)/NOL1/NOP2/fmu family ribosome biogenesis protein